MEHFTAKTFTIPTLKGISQKTIDEHLKLYSGYVTHSNLVLEKITELSKNAEENMGLISGLERRFGFEFNGMRNHEYYFSSLEGGPSDLADASELKKQIEKDFGSFENWLTSFKALATTRGVGWAMLYYDRETKQLLNAWIDEQHLGQLSSCAPVLALDMWEHSFVMDYAPSGKKNYIEDFFSNINWGVIEKNFSNAQQ